MALFFPKEVFTRLERSKLCPIYNAQQDCLSLEKQSQKVPFGATRWQSFKGLNLKQFNANPPFFPNWQAKIPFDIKKSDLKVT